MLLKCRIIICYMFCLLDYSGMALILWILFDAGFSLEMVWVTLLRRTLPDPDTGMPVSSVEACRALIFVSTESSGS